MDLTKRRAALEQEMAETQALYRRAVVAMGESRVRLLRLEGALAMITELLESKTADG